MKFIRSEKCGPYVVFMSGVDGKEVQTQIFVGNKVKSESVTITKTQADRWVQEQLQQR